jgi:hypothetical protein
MLAVLTEPPFLPLQDESIDGDVKLESTDDDVPAAGLETEIKTEEVKEELGDDVEAMDTDVKQDPEVKDEKKDEKLAVRNPS